MILYLVRHGETDYNRRQIVQGRGIDAPLNAKGHAQAAALAAHLADEPLTALYTSSLRRSQESARPFLAARPQLPTFALAGFDEMSWGQYEGRTPTPEIRAAFRDLFDKWGRGYVRAALPGGENLRQVQGRALAALAEVVAAHPPEATVLIISHGRLLRILLSSILPGYGLSRMHEIVHTNMGLNKVEQLDGTYRLHYLNQTHHLDEIGETE